jgi:hypothetical protein
MSIYHNRINSMSIYHNKKYKIRPVLNGGGVCPNKLFLNTFGSCWMDAILTVVLYSDATQDNFQEKLLKFTKCEFSQENTNNIFIPFNIKPENIQQFMELCSVFGKNLKDKFSVSDAPEDMPLTYDSSTVADTFTEKKLTAQQQLILTAEIEPRRRRNSMFHGASCDLSLQKIFNINKRGVSKFRGGHYIDVYITINVLNYLFMTPEKYIQVDIHLSPDYYKWNSITDTDIDNAIGIHIGSGKHALGCFTCSNESKYYDDNYTFLTNLDWKRKLKTMRDTNNWTFDELLKDVPNAKELLDNLGDSKSIENLCIFSLQTNIKFNKFLLTTYHTQTILQFYNVDITDFDFRYDSQIQSKYGEYIFILLFFFPFFDDVNERNLYIYILKKIITNEKLKVRNTDGKTPIDVAKSYKLPPEIIDILENAPDSKPLENTVSAVTENGTIVKPSSAILEMVPTTKSYKLPPEIIDILENAPDSKPLENTVSAVTENGTIVKPSSAILEMVPTTKPLENTVSAVTNTDNITGHIYPTNNTLLAICATDRRCLCMGALCICNKKKEKRWKLVKL